MLSLGPSSDTEAISQMVDTLACERFHQPILEFVKVLKKEDSNAEFWWNYMEKVSSLLYFTRAQRDGLWELHLYAFRHMLPFFFRYDHVTMHNGVQYTWMRWPKSLQTSCVSSSREIVWSSMQVDDSIKFLQTTSKNG